MKLHKLEKELKQKGIRFVCGLDEAGRGPWAGPIVAAAVILPGKIKLPGLKDSKKLNSKKREKLFSIIERHANYGIGIVSHTEIDRLGIVESTQIAFEKALSALSSATQPEYLLIDGRDQFFFGIPAISIIKGDTKVRCIAAASILAKVTRDRIMDEFDKEFPLYGFCKNKGYGVLSHHRAIIKHGICQIHRRTYEPIKTLTSK